MHKLSYFMQLLWMGLKSNTSIIYVSYTHYVCEPKVFWKKGVYFCVSVSLRAMWLQMSLKVWSRSDQWVTWCGCWEPRPVLPKQQQTFCWVISLGPYKVFLMWLHFYCDSGKVRHAILQPCQQTTSLGYCGIQIADVWTRDTWSKDSLKRPL